MMLRKMLITAALTALAVPAAAAAQVEDITTRLNRMPGQTAQTAPPEAEPTPAPSSSIEDFTSRLNSAPVAAGPAAPPEAEPEPPEPGTASGTPILEGLSERLGQRRQPQQNEPEPAPAPAPPEPATPEAEPDIEAESEPAVETEAETEAEVEPAPEPAPPPELETVASQAGLAFRVDLPAGFDLIERPSGPDFDVYQVSRDGTPFVGIYVGCCSPFPIYDGRQTETAGRSSIIAAEDGANRAVEHLFRRESDGRQIHVWLHSVTGEDRAIAERIAQTVDPR